MELQEQSIKKTKNQKKTEEMEPVLRIRDIFVRIRIRIWIRIRPTTDPAIFLNEHQDGN